MNRPSDAIGRTREKVAAFQREAQDLLGRYESSTKQRVISLQETWRKLRGLSLLQNDLLAEALLCVEAGIYRAAHVMAWAAFIDVMEEILNTDGLASVRRVRPKWLGLRSVEDLRENHVEYQIIEVAREVGLISKSEMKTFHGMLARRNECGHPSRYDPGLNEALGFAAEVLNRIESLKGRKFP